VPEQPDGGLVPPVKVLRKRLNGVYRADGFSGPTRRYVLVVALLVGLASLPTLAAITAGTNELDRGTTGAMDVPFLPPPSSGPIVPAPAPSSGVAHGQAGKQHTRPQRNGRSDVPGSAAAGGTGRRSASSSGSRGEVSRSRGEASGSGGQASGARGRGSGSRQEASGSREEASGSRRGASGPRGDTSGPRGRASGPRGDASGSSGRGKGSAPAPVRDGAAGRPSGSGRSAPPTKDPNGVPVPPGHPEPDADDPPFLRPPFCHDRAECGVWESRHHRPDWARHRRCENATHRARWSHNREDHPRGQARHARHDPRVVHQESTVTERLFNARPARWGDRTHNSRRHRAQSR
jgi:hypothetical protein